MIAQPIKDFYYLTFGKLSLLSYAWHRAFSRGKFRGAWVNIGCGPHYVPGMVNVDGNIFRKKEVWMDVTLGLPFATGSVRGVYASQIVEHFKPARARRVFAEFHRVLEPGGTLRLVVPSLEYAVEAYRQGDVSKFGVWPENYDSIGGRFNNFMLCGNQHFLMFDFSLLCEMLGKAGFRDFRRAEPRQSGSFKAEFLQFEPFDNGKSLFMECTK